MKMILLLCLLAVSLCDQRFLKEEIYKSIKESASWEAYDLHENPFRDYTEEQIRSLFGVRLSWTNENQHLFVDNDDHSRMMNVPASYDFRTEWSECVSVRDQQHCGSCWAFSGSTALSERFCFASNKKTIVTLSPQDSVSCDTENYGCQGGMLDTTWKYYENTGIVTDACFPYVSGDGVTVPDCPAGRCVDPKDQYVKYRAEQSHPLICESQIKDEIMTNGPVQTGFIVYEDFMQYKSGIYQHKTGRQLGGHAVVIIGWGEEKGVKYWLVQNSWGPNWGEKGFFRIKIGDCQMDKNGYAGLPKLSDFYKNFLYYTHPSQ